MHAGKVLGYFILVLGLVSLIPVAYAQLGEIAGAVNISVSVGGTGSGAFTAINPTNQSQYYQVQLPVLSGGVANELLPDVAIIPMNGTIGPHASQTFNVIVTIPSNDTAGSKWSGMATVNPSPPPGVSGARIEIGIAKEININALPAKPTDYLPYVVVGAVVAVLIGASLYYLKARSKSSRFKRR